MQAILLHQCGEPERLVLEDVSTPEIKTDTEVKIRIKAASVNPLDTKLRAGLYPIDQFPTILGCDAAGIIEAVGSDVSGFKPGDEVYYFYGGIGGKQGNYAEYNVIDEKHVATKPANISFDEAAALPLVILTAWEALFDRCKLSEGQTVFINAGAGGVGHVAIQLAKQAKATVITTVSHSDKAEFVKSIGADFVINYQTDNVLDAVMEYTQGQGVDIAMDNVGGKQTEQLFPLVKFYGDVVSLLLPASDLDWAIARQRNLRFSLEVMLTPLLFNIETALQHQTSILNQARTLIELRKLRTRISQRFSLTEIAEAHRSLEKGHTLGKLILNL